MHIEIPDGVLPPWLWIAGFVLVAALLVIAIYFAKKEEEKMPLAALFAALSLIVMSIPLGLPVHINLMVLVGIIVGPWWALIVSFIVNSLLASLGHGGITVIGLNTLLLWSQALFGFYLFGLAKGIIQKKGSALKGVLGGVVTFLSLMVSFLLLGGLVFAVNLNPEEVLIHNHDHHHHEEDHGHEHEESHHEDEEDHDHDEHEESDDHEPEDDHGHEEHHEDHEGGHEESHEHENDQSDHHEEDHGDNHHEGDFHEDEESHDHSHSHDPEDYYDDEISLRAFFVIALPIFLYAAIIESIVVGMAISFISKGKPELL